MTEAQMVGVAKRWLGKHYPGWRCVKFVSPGHAGVPDDILLGPGGVLVFIEWKIVGGTVSPMQKRWHKWLREKGHRVEVLYTLDRFYALVAEMNETAVPF